MSNLFDENIDICRHCKHLYFVGRYPCSVPWCDISDNYNKNFFPLILTGWYNCSIVSCSDFIEKKPVTGLVPMAGLSTMQ